MRQRSLSSVLATFLIVLLIIVTNFEHLAIAAPEQSQLEAKFFVGSRVYMVNEDTRQMDAAPFIDTNGRLQVPVRYLAMAVGVPEEGIIYEDSSQTVTLAKGTTVVVLRIGSSILNLNGQARVMDTPPVLSRGRTFLPARYVAEAFGCEVVWEESSSTVIIRRSAVNEPSAPTTTNATKVHTELPTKLTAKDIAAEASQAVVYITTRDFQGKELGQGTGFLATDDGKIVTNYHVIKDASVAVISLNDGRVFEVSGLVNYDGARDIAVLQVPLTSTPKVHLGNSDTATVGEEIVVISNPLGLRNSVTTGVISSTDRIIEGQKWLQISAPVSPGSSGAPVFNSKSEVIGVVTMGIEPAKAQNLNFAVPINDVKALLNAKRPAAFSDLFRPARSTMSYADFAAYVNSVFKTRLVGSYLLTFDRVRVEEVGGDVCVSLILSAKSDLDWLNAQLSGYHWDIEKWLLEIFFTAKLTYPEKSIVIGAWLVDYYWFCPSAWPSTCIRLQPDGTWLVVYPKVIITESGGYPKVTWAPLG